ncbi:hypothetical protein C8R43DRAFT_593925 [Mycena crocata]|nr:hypothetical protein C8R43DRAFT_593925 [Mycena crocata]
MYRKINPKLGRPRACTPEAEPQAPTNDDEDDEDEDGDDEYSASDSDQVGAKRKRRRRTSSPRPACHPLIRKNARRKSVPPARNTESVLLPVRWSLRSKNRDLSTPRQTSQPGKALYDTPVPSEDEDDVEVGKRSAPKRKRNLPSSRPFPTTPANIDANTCMEDPDSNDDEECAFMLAAPPSLLHLIRRSPSLSSSHTPHVSGSAFSSRSSLSPPPPSPRPTSPRASTPPSDAPHCGNCLSTTSPGGWRRSILEPETRLCNACSKYERKHHRHRPSALNQRRKMKRFPPSASPRCSNCRSPPTSAHWNRSALELEWRLCDACSRYERRHHRHRPSALNQRRKIQRFSPSASPHCANCQSTSASTYWSRSVLQPEWRLCHACYMYEAKHHRHRPLALAQAASNPDKPTRKRKKISRD